jgi:hypothetical protein
MANIILKKAGGATATGTSITVVEIFDCALTVSVGDVVYPSISVDNFVISNTDNTVIIPSIGIVVSKPTSTTCGVQLYGPCSLIISGIDRAKKVFLATDGTLTTTPPTTGYLQKIGFSYEQNRVFIDPYEVRVKRS